MGGGNRSSVVGGQRSADGRQRTEDGGPRIDRENLLSIVNNMKTTIDIADLILRRAKRVAGEEGVTLRELAEEGLEMALQKRAARKTKGFRLVTFGDPKGEPVSVDWEAVRGLVYPT